MSLLLCPKNVKVQSEFCIRNWRYITNIKVTQPKNGFETKTDVPRNSLKKLDPQWQPSESDTKITQFLNITVYNRKIMPN